MGVSAGLRVSSTLQSGQLSRAAEVFAFSSRSRETVLGGLLDFAGGVSGAESESGGEPGGEKGESGGEPGPESGREPGPESTGESGGDPGGESSAFSPSPETMLVAELKRDEPKLNICEAAAGGLADSVSPPRPPNSFPATDSSCLDAACACGLGEESIRPPKPPNSFPVTDSAAGCDPPEGLATSVRPPRLIPPKPPKKLDSCLALAGDCCGLDLAWRGRPVLGSIFGEPAGERGPGEAEPGDFCLGVVGGVSPCCSLVLCCFISSLPGFPDACLCGEGGAEPCLGLVAPGGSMPPIARCI